MGGLPSHVEYCFGIKLWYYHVAIAYILYITQFLMSTMDSSPVRFVEGCRFGVGELDWACWQPVCELVERGVNHLCSSTQSFISSSSVKLSVTLSVSSVLVAPQGLGSGYK